MVREASEWRRPLYCRHSQWQCLASSSRATQDVVVSGVWASSPSISCLNTGETEVWTILGLR
jgi:hypothetical protein